MMPLRRTPPPSTAGQSTSTVSPSRTQSETDLSGVLDGVTIRSKRFREEESMTDFMDGMMNLLREFKDEQNRKFDALQDSIAGKQEQQSEKLNSLQQTTDEIRKQNDAIYISMEYLLQENAELKEKVQKMENEQKESTAYIRTLEGRIEGMERQGRCSSIEIRNVPVSTTESKEDLLKIILSITTALKVDASASDVCDVYRINTKIPTQKPIICNLNSVLIKERILKSLKNFNKAHRGNRFSTEHIHIKGAAQPVFVSENLTPKSRRLFFLARDLANSNDYSYCWVTHGRIFLRKREGEKLIRVDSELDLAKLQNVNK